MTLNSGEEYLKFSKKNPNGARRILSYGNTEFYLQPRIKKVVETVHTGDTSVSRNFGDLKGIIKGKKNQYLVEDENHVNFLVGVGDNGKPLIDFILPSEIKELGKCLYEIKLHS